MSISKTNDMVLLALLILTCITILTFVALGHDRKYVNTEYGLVSYGSFYCPLGVLLNHQQRNVYDVDGKPIQCSREILTLNDSEKAEFKL